MRLFVARELATLPRRIADPMMGSGTTRDVIASLKELRGTAARSWGADLRSGFDPSCDSLPGPFDLVGVHAPYWDISFAARKATRAT